MKGKDLQWANTLSDGEQGEIRAMTVLDQPKPLPHAQSVGQDGLKLQANTTEVLIYPLTQ